MSAIDDLCRTLARLRAPGGCPWDREQTHESLARCLVDECSELLETIDCKDMPHMREELGDVLIQVVFHAQIASEGGHFNFDDVARDIDDKLIRRHPHVFGTARADTTPEVLVEWDRIKAEERAARGQTDEPLFKGLPPRLPALMFAEAVWKQVVKKNLPVRSSTVDRVRVDELAEGLDDEMLGRRLFELAAAARTKGLDPEGALRRQGDRVMKDAAGA